MDRQSILGDIALAAVEAEPEKPQQKTRWTRELMLVPRTAEFHCDV